MRFRSQLRALLLTVHILAPLILIYLSIEGGAHIRGQNVNLMGMDILCLIIAFIFSLSIIRSGRQDPETTAFLFLLFFDAIHLFCDAVFLIVDGDPGLRIWNIVLNTAYLICPLIMMRIYWKMLDIWAGREESRYKWADLLINIAAILGTILVIINVFTGFYFGISPDGYYYRGDLHILTIIIPMSMIIFCLIRVLGSDIPVLDKVVLLLYPVIPSVAASTQNMFDQFSAFPITMFLAVVFIYTNIYSSKEARLAELENKMALSKLYSLQVKMNPHMMFNTLSSIAGMCDIDPGKAQDMIFKLSDYMRDNFTDIEKPSMVTLREELETLDHYIAIEVIRFPNIKVVKDIQEDGFMIPVMSLQPVVENAIKYGICKRRRAEGVITIRSYENDDAWVVTVADNGVGFEGSIPEGSMYGHHGIYNVRTRLSILCGGTLDVVGDPGNGAVATIRIPKNEMGGGTTPHQNGR